MGGEHIEGAEDDDDKAGFLSLAGVRHGLLVAEAPLAGATALAVAAVSPLGAMGRRGTEIGGGEVGGGTGFALRAMGEGEPEAPGRGPTLADPGTGGAVLSATGGSIVSGVGGVTVINGATLPTEGSAWPVT
jgi:hypothetical protein